MRTATAALGWLLLASVAATAQPPTAGGRLHADPRRPGFWVIKPQLAGVAPVVGPGESVLQEAAPVRSPAAKPGVPSVGDAPPPKPVPVAPAAEPAPAKADEGKLVLETWDALFVRDLRIGYFHVTVKEHVRDGKTYLYATKTSRMWVARFGQKVEQWAEDFSMESADDGRVIANRSSQGLGREQMLTLTGRVEGPALKLKIEGEIKDEKTLPWPDGVLGVAGEAVLFAERKPKPGDKFSYLSFEARVGRVVKFDVAAERFEEMPAWNGQPKRKVLRLTVGMEPIGDFRLAPATIWCDAETFEPIQMEQDVPGFGGRTRVVRTDKASATRPVGKVPDLFDVQSIRLNRPVPNVHEAASVMYKVTTAGDVPAVRLFPADERQVQANAADKSVEVTATPPPASAPAQPVPGPECLSSSFFIDWDNPTVKRHAAAAVAGLPADAPALTKARAVERWVRDNMKSTEFSQAMATCSNVANSLSGDCSEYSMLAAGMCRALGIPSRTALGVVYAEDKERAPFLAYHVWFEAYSGGRWVGLDATLGRGQIGAGHLKITDAHWHEERSFAPLLPVLAVLQSGPKVEVMKVEP